MKMIAFICVIRNSAYSWVLWLTPVILATQEAKIRRIMVQSQPRQIVLETLSKKLITKRGWQSSSRCKT
jgi:hypothetical protein